MKYCTDCKKLIGFSMEDLIKGTQNQKLKQCLLVEKDKRSWNRCKECYLKVVRVLVGDDGR